MKSPAFAPPSTTSSSDSDRCLVALAIDLSPLKHSGSNMQRVRLLHLDSPYLALVFKAGIDSLLHAHRCLVGTVSMEGDLIEGLIKFQTTNRQQAIEALRQHCAATHYETFACIAWFDDSELAWRIVERGIFPGTLEEFCADERRQARMRRNTEMAQYLEESLALIKQADEGKK